MDKISRKLQRFVAILLCVTVVCSQSGIVYASEIGISDDLNTDTALDSAVTGVVVGEDTFELNEAVYSADNEQSEQLLGNSFDSVSDNDTDVNETGDVIYNVEDYYRNGSILIYNYRQLLEVASSNIVYTGDKDGDIGSGSMVMVDGTPLTYGSDAVYCLVSDIPMDISHIWNLTSSFSGSFASTSEPSTTVYDADSDTIYIHNRYQLAVLSGEDKMKIVTTGDYDAANLGIGQVITDSRGEQVEYTTEHNYVIAMDFTTDLPEMNAMLFGADDALVGDGEEQNYWENDVYKAGREYFGQVVKEVDGIEYILIGNETQLREIGSGLKITEPIWKVVQKRTRTEKFGKDEYSPWLVDSVEMYYPGDADLLYFDSEHDYRQTSLYSSKSYKGEKLGKAYSGKSSGIGDALSPDIEGSATIYTQYIGSDYDKDLDTLTYADGVTEQNHISQSSATYDLDANYIIFRNIDLNEESNTSNAQSDKWNPIENFSGTMEGRLNMETGINASIIHVTIQQTAKLNQSQWSKSDDEEEFSLTEESEMGIGFFRNLTTPYDNVLTTDASGNKKLTMGIGNKIKVSHLTLDTVSVTVDESLKGVSKGVKYDATLLGVVLTGLLKLLSIDSGLQPDEISLATGSFVGVVKGNVEIDSCEVRNVQQVSSPNQWTGGFAGYVSGTARYEVISGLLLGLSETLTKVLNIIPFLGLGDLISVLLTGGVLKVGELIPVGYTNAKISNCSVEYNHSSGQTHLTGTEYVGGFAGETIGSSISHCKVIKTNSLNVEGEDYVGGFIGKMSNAVIEGLLSNLGINLGSGFPVNTILLDDDIDGAGELHVVAVPTNTSGILLNKPQTGFAGGFAGSISNSYAIDCGITNLADVSGGEYVGGFTGKASSGDFVSTDDNRDLLKLLSNVLTGILGGSVTDTSLLNLVGIRPSVIAGAQITGDTVTITSSKAYAGGLVGYAGAVQILNTMEMEAGSQRDTAEDLNQLLAALGISYSFSQGSGDSLIGRNNFIQCETLEVTGITAAGGAIGMGKMTGVADVLGDTVTVANYMRFEMQDVTLSTSETNILATKEDSYAGGIIGSGIGGTISEISLTGLKSVLAGTAAGGFAGAYGSGKLADVGGINLLGLNLLKIDGIASVGGMIETKVDSAVITGVRDGYTVETTDTSGYSGGFVGQCISGKAEHIRMENLLKVTASDQAGKAGGFAGEAKAGDAVATVGDHLSSKANSSLSVLEISDLLGVVSALTPEFNEISISFLSSEPVNVKADMAGGFIGDGEAINVNATASIDALRQQEEQYQDSAEEDGEDTTGSGDSQSNDESSTTLITGLRGVEGVTYAGGFAGRLQPGDLAKTGSIQVLGLLNAASLLSVVDVSFPSVTDATVEGSHLSVSATGLVGETHLTVGEAGGYIGSAKAVLLESCNVSGLTEVSAPYRAGGYAGMIQPGSAASLGSQSGGDLLNGVLSKILNIQEIANVLQAGSSKITNSYVSGDVKDGLVVTAQIRDENKKYEYKAQGYAGGFVGEMQSGLVDNTETIGQFTSANDESAAKGTAVANLKAVYGLRYAGGFGGKVSSGAVAQIGSGSTSILGDVVSASGLLSLVNAFVPVIKHASVRSVSSGFTVEITGSDKNEETTTEKEEEQDNAADGESESTKIVEELTNDSNTGSAGGFIGAGIGVQITSCDVESLARTRVTEPSDLQIDDTSSFYYDSQASSYSVTGYRYAGGFFGTAAPGSTASVGGANVLKKLVDLDSLANALSVVAPVIEDSDVYGALGGFNVLASNSDGTMGMAGGFGGYMPGVHIQDSNVRNFYHIIGRESAGGYAGTIEPGSAAEVGSISILSGLINADNLLSAVSAFVPTIRNSETTCIPCGGVVRAESASSDSKIRGLAGGYVGHNLAGEIWGNDSSKWKGEIPSEQIQKKCAVYRIRSVYGTEYAGGFTGYMECGNLADTGSLSVLGGLVKLSNPLSALQAVYATEESTAVYGPLRGLDVKTWNGWVNAVGSYGAYGNQIKGLGSVAQDASGQALLNEYIDTYAYGYEVTAGRKAVAEHAKEGGAAGGYVGRMEGGTITYANAFDVKTVDAYRASGGFAGEMITGSVADVGGISALGIDVLKGSLGVLETFVPVIKDASASGYQSGATIIATGYVNDGKKTNAADNLRIGFAGGFVGHMIGGQIWGLSASDEEKEEEASRCQVNGLRRVSGTSYVGGFVGKAEPGGAADVDVTSSNGLLSRVLGTLIKSPSNLLSVLDATIPTIRYADVNSLDDWGFTLDGSFSAEGEANTKYAKAVGGFAGYASGIVIGDQDEASSGARVSGLRSVIGGEYAGGFIGVAESSSVATLSGDDSTTILTYLATIGRTDVLSAFRSYVYYSSVEGTDTVGMTVSAMDAQKYGEKEAAVYSGNAGGFAGAVNNGTVKNSTASNLKTIQGINSTGGFIGYSGKSGLVSVDEITVAGGDADEEDNENTGFKLLGGSLGVLDVFGSTIEDCDSYGSEGGYYVISTNGHQSIAGGFVGFANLAQIKNCHAGGDTTQGRYGLAQVYSSGMAGGFAGKTSHAYLADIQLSSTVLDLVFLVVNGVLRLIRLDKIQDTELVNLNIIPNWLEIHLAHDGDLVALNLLGLRIAVGLTKNGTTDSSGNTVDLATIRIGDSTIKLPCNEEGILRGDTDADSQLSVSLLKANRTRIRNSSVTGIGKGYDVYGGGASYEEDGTSDDGYAGGFIGYNDEGLLEDNNMYLCDEVRGSAGLIGPFTGKSQLETVYTNLVDLQDQEGQGNLYRIYRMADTTLASITDTTGKKLNTDFTPSDEFPGNVYLIRHMQEVTEHSDLKNATLSAASTSRTTSRTSSGSIPLEAYISSSKAVLMGNTKTIVPDEEEEQTPTPADMQDPCDEFLTITVNKIWKDHKNQDRLRPTDRKISVTLHRTYEVEADGKTVEETDDEFRYTFEVSGSGNVWSRTISGSDEQKFPAYKSHIETDPVTGKETTVIDYYYTYYVTEDTNLTGYQTKITAKDDNTTFDITNHHFSVLPDTGGKGILVFLLLGSGVLALMAYTGYRKKRNKKGVVA